MASDGPTEPRRPTVKRLFALSGNRCAFPDCTTPLVDQDTGSILAEMCHIKGEKPTAARYDAAQDNESRHGFDNLILLCNVHHKIIDDNEAEYSVERLSAMKEQHETHQRGKVKVDDATSERLVSALLTSQEGLSNINQAGDVIAGQNAHTINNYFDGKLPIAAALIAILLVVALMYAWVQSLTASATPGNKDSVVFGQIELSTSDCAWEPMKRPIEVVAPVRNFAGAYSHMGGPPIGSAPQQGWPMGSHQLWPFEESVKNDNLDDDPIFDVTLVNKGPHAVVVARIGIKPIAAWTSPKGPPFSGRIINFDSYSLDVDGFDPAETQFLRLPEPVSLVPNDPYRFKLQLEGFCQNAPRNETVIQLVIEVNQEIIASDDIYLGLFSSTERPHAATSE